MYKLIENPMFHTIASVQRIEDGAFIPFDPANVDYINFKIQVADGTPLEDPDGNVMTQAEVNAFLETIP